MTGVFDQVSSSSTTIKTVMSISLSLTGKVPEAGTISHLKFCLVISFNKLNLEHSIRGVGSVTVRSSQRLTHDSLT
jgi:hypothetical protein